MVDEYEKVYNQMVMSEGPDNLEAARPIEPKPNISKIATPEKPPASNDSELRNRSIERVNSLRKQKEYANATVWDKLEAQIIKNTTEEPTGTLT